MAVVRNLMIRGGADFSAMQRSMRQAGRATQNFRRSFHNAAKRIMQVSAVVGATVAYTSHRAIKAAEEEIIAQTKLYTVMRQRMNATDDMVESVIALANEQQRLGVISDDATVSGAQQLATFLRTGDSLKQLIPAMNNLVAQQSGVSATASDTVRIANMMGRVLEGNVSALTRVGISFSETQSEILKYGTEAEKAATLSQIITDNVGEMNEALADTSPGRVAQLQNAISDLQKSFGHLVMPLRDAFVPILHSIVLQLGRIIERLKPAIQYATMFLNTLFGNKAVSNAKAATNATSKQADAYEDIEDAAKAATRQLYGFDEINQLQKETADEGIDFGEVFGEIGETEQTDGIIDGFEDATQAALKFKETIKKLGNVMSENSDLIIAGLAGVGAAFVTTKAIMNFAAITAAIKPVKKAVVALATVFGIKGFIAVVAIGAIITALVLLWQRSEEFRNVVTAIWEEIQVAMHEVWQELKNLKGPLKELKEEFLELFDLVTPELVWLAQLIGTVMVGNMRIFIAVTKVLVRVLQGGINAWAASIKAASIAFKGLRSMLYSLTDVSRNVFNGIIRMINSMLSEIGKLANLLSKIPGIDVSFGEIPQIPEIPLIERAGASASGTDNFADLAAAIRDMGGDTTVKLEIGGTEFEQVVAKAGRDYLARTGGQLA